ncbi:hypothetical protein OF855_24570 [Mycolicibacterium fortuitum]|uniref:hypothetical protein n=1 Tax=Mycolicibacterium fortuitum TaxID=1766 RepID=UPI0022BA2165|nr:hypothetical protein [Mycolicibacterium fortuitum]WAY18415.1 hypothetical protein OF855_24570 [Mycolicibacterium fortuitum]
MSNHDELIARAEQIQEGVTPGPWRHEIGEEHGETVHFVQWGIEAQAANEELRDVALSTVKSFLEVEIRGELYDAATHRWVDLLAEVASRD